MSQPMEGHTVQRFDAELNELHLLVTEMGGLVLNQLDDALNAVYRLDPELARSVADRDRSVNGYEVKVEGKAVSIIARRGPMARDLRTVMAISRAVSDLERTGDEAAKIASTVQTLKRGTSSDRPDKTMLNHVFGLGSRAAARFREAMDAFDSLDVQRAEQLLSGEGELDEELESAVQELAAAVHHDGARLSSAIQLVLVLKALERVVEFAGNVAEYVIYLLTGHEARAPDGSFSGGGAAPA